MVQNIKNGVGQLIMKRPRTNNKLSKDKRPWYQKFEKILPWITLIAVVFGWLLHYGFIDYFSAHLHKQLTKESKENTKLIKEEIIKSKSKTQEIAENIKHISSQILLEKTTVSHLNDPVEKALEKLRTGIQDTQCLID